MVDIVLKILEIAVLLMKGWKLKTENTYYVQLSRVQFDYVVRTQFS